MGDFSKFVGCMAHIRESGVKWPKIRSETSTGRPVGFALGSKGAVFVKDGYGRADPVMATLRPDGSPVWLSAARRLPVAEKPALWALLKGLRDDPEAALAEMGKRLGFCCICGRPLSNAESVDLGMGPKCRSRMFGG